MTTLPTRADVVAAVVRRRELNQNAIARHKIHRELYNRDVGELSPEEAADHYIKLQQALVDLDRVEADLGSATITLSALVAQVAASERVKIP